MNLLKWILFPSVMLTPRFGGDEGGGDTAGDNAKAEEERKTTLRRRIDRLYGVADTTPQTVTETVAADAPDAQRYRMIDNGEAGVQYVAENSPAATFVRAADGSYVPAGAGATTTRTRTVTPDSDPEAQAAAAQMEAENTRLADATRAYHTDQLGREYQKAERDTRFRLARSGLLGGSEDIYQQGDVRSDRDLGATRVDQAVRSAVAGLKTQRENERLNAINLVNSGAGDSAVSSAQAGLRNSFDVANSQQRANLFGDLFQNAVDANAAAGAAAQNAALAERYKTKLATFFPNGSSSSGRITPSS